MVSGKKSGTTTTTTTYFQNVLDIQSFIAECREEEKRARRNTGCVRDLE